MGVLTADRTVLT